MQNNEREEVKIRTKQLKRWANTLYFISKQGLEYSRNKYDIKRYNDIKDYSESIYISWKKSEEEKFGYLTFKQLGFFIQKLEKIVELGLIKAHNNFDENRYLDVSMILEDIKRVNNNYLKNKEKSKEITKKETEKEKIFLTNFFSDEKLAKEIENLIANTKDSLCICSPWISDITSIKDKLINLRENKVDIQILTRQAEIDSDHFETLKEFKRNKCQIETNNKLHTKLIISDKKTLYLGSANLVGRSMEILREAGVISKELHLVNSALEYFNTFYDESGENRMIE